MSEGPDWLPPLVSLNDHGGDWQRYIEAVYAVFSRDFIASQPKFQGCWVRCPREPIIDGKEGTFWHCVSEGLREDQRNPCIRRTERIPWIRPVIEHAGAAEVDYWVSPRGNTVHHLLWFHEEYLVVLKQVVRKRDGFRYFVVKTAYPTDWGSTLQYLRGQRDRALGKSA